MVDTPDFKQLRSRCQVTLLSPSEKEHLRQPTVWDTISLKDDYQPLPFA